MKLAAIMLTAATIALVGVCHFVPDLDPSILLGALASGTLALIA